MRDLDRIARSLIVQEAVLAQLWTFGGHAFVVTDTAEIACDDPDDPMRTARYGSRPWPCSTGWCAGAGSSEDQAAD